MALRASDSQTLVDLTDGVSVVLSSESYNFPAGTTNAIAGNTTTKVQALQGGAYVPAVVVVANVTAPAGVTVTSDNDPVSPTLTIAVATSVTAGGEVNIPVVVDGLTINKKFSFGLAKQGIQGNPGGTGTSATFGGLKNEASMIPATAAGAVLATTDVTVDFYGFTGNSRVATSIAVASGFTLPSGVTIKTNTPGTTSADGILVLTFAAGSTLGGVDSSNIPFDLTVNGQARRAYFSWSKAKQGATGAAGADAVTLVMDSSNGNIFKNTGVSTTLTARVYVGGVEITGAAITPYGTIKWYKDGTYLTGKDGSTLTVAASDVPDRAKYEARLEY